MMKKQTNLKSRQLGNTFENWLSEKVEYEISRFSPDESIKIHEKSKELIIAEAETRLKKEKDRIEKTLLSAPSGEKYLQLESDIVSKILHKDIDFQKKVGFGPDAGYYKTGWFEYDIRQIESIRHNYRSYLRGEINYIGKTPAIDYYKADDIIEAIKFYKLEKWLNELNSISTKLKPERSLLKFNRDDANQKLIDNVLQKCKDNLNGINFDLGSYAALYLVIFNKYCNIFKSNTSFTDVRKMFDKFFNKDTHNYKPGNIKEKAAKLKSVYLWIDKL